MVISTFASPYEFNIFIAFYYWRRYFCFSGLEIATHLLYLLPGISNVSPEVSPFQRENYRNTQLFNSHMLADIIWGTANSCLYFPGKHLILMWIYLYIKQRKIITYCSVYGIKLDAVLQNTLEIYIITQME